VIRILAVALLGLCSIFAQTPAPSLSDTLKRVEARYNRARTLQVSFEETYAAQGRGKRTESGELSLRKPGRMRWDYKSPAGKLFLSDGKYIYYYNPAANRAERMSMKESDDMRAPLAFLLGKLDFDQEFKNFRSTPEGSNTLITADAKSERLPYRQVEFLVSPQSEILRLTVTGQDTSLMSFNFSGEKMNPKLDDKLFRLDLPSGVTLMDSAGKEAGN
jgi:outer membrane lipoprotein carrier protein